MRVLLLSKYSRKGASSRLRSLQYLPLLAEKNINVTVSNLFDDRYLEALYLTGRKVSFRTAYLYVKRLLTLLTAYRYDMLWIEKELFPYCPAVCEAVLSATGVNYIVDYDDAIFHKYDLAKSGLIRKALGKKIDTVMASSACVVVGNKYLAERARAAGAPRVEIIPTVVDCRRYDVPKVRNKGALVIGWMGSPSTQHYLLAIKDALQEVCTVLNAKVMLVGATADIIDHLAGIPVEILPWIETTEAENIAKMDVGIMPLIEGPWENGKCGYKLIQYMAGGVAVVASPVGANTEILEGNDCGRLARGVDEWSSILIDLLSDCTLRDDLGKQGRNRVKQKYSLHSQSELLADIIESASRS